MTTFHVTLAEKPAAILVYLAEGPAMPEQIAKDLEIPSALYGGGLGLLHELGLAALDQGTGRWALTEDGKQLAAESLAELEAHPAVEALKASTSKEDNDGH